MRKRMRRTVRNVRLAHKVRTLSWEVGALRRRLGTDTERHGNQLALHEREKAAAFKYSIALDIALGQTLKLGKETTALLLDEVDRLKRVPRFIRALFGAG